MPYEMYLRHYDRAGTLKNAVLEPNSLRFTDSVSGQEPLVFTLDADHPMVSSIAAFDIFEIMLRNKELGLTNFTRVGVAIQRHWSLETDDDGLDLYTFTAPSDKHILSWRHVQWYAGVADRSDFSAVKAETVMKTLVKYNLTSFATVANGRLREGNLSTTMGVDVTIAADTARGNNVSIGCQGDNILSVLQKLENGGGGDFSWVWSQGTNDWTFEFVPGQLGTDKSSGANRVLFSVDNNTMLRPRLQYQGAGATAGIAGGKGDKSARLMQPITGPDYNAATYNIETFVDGRNENDAAGLTFRGGIRLEELRSKAALDFDVLQTANQFYSPVAVTGRKTYKAGDRVLANYGGSDWVRKIDSVSMEWKPPDRDDAFQVSISTIEVPSGS